MESIGGYRIIRKLGSGSRGDVFLGHGGTLPGGEPQLVAIKLFHPHVSESSMDAEISALSVLSHAHIVSLLDLATGPRNVPCLILQRLEPGGLPRLVAERRELEAGEAVTILAPLVEAVSAMHREGVFHGRLSARAVLFDASGAPTLGGFGGAGTIGSPDGPRVTPAMLDADAGMTADRDALVTLVGSVLGRVGDGRSLVEELVRGLGERRWDEGGLVDLGHRLFELASPVPVRFDADTRPSAVPHRFDGTLPDPAPEAGLRPTGLWAQAKVPDRLVSAWAALHAVAGTVSRRVWILGGVGLVAIASAIVVGQLPASDRESGAAPSGPGPGLPRPAASATGSDDPIMAAGQLVELRAKCLDDRSISCLDAVHAPASAAWQADAARIHAVQGGAELAPDSFGRGSSFVLIDRMGDTALLGLAPAGLQPAETTTASVLMIRTEAGWRFRSLLDGAVPLDGGQPDG